MPAVQAWLIEPLWLQFSALLPVRPEFDPTHPLGVHRRRLDDRIVFDKLIQVLRFGCSYQAIADTTCSATTIRSRRDEWIKLGVFAQQEVRGSNPLGSTSQNAASLVRESGVRAINVPLARRDQRAGQAVIIVPSLRFHAHAQGICDLLVSVARGVLVDQRGPVAVMSHPRLEIRKTCP
ncbi:MAG: transposase [Sphaerisporangium sp.]|nr:transposase [Sphaerisporangium sp.]